ncbi:hypothetical protein AN639_01900 [Candidatus Epulonipiscium fishelsonii]|uniref:Uncharacterized protein n=1 Tax=Candidatus Epulonipiscium fishelsonii TaxID=77094 RepID=A0ACC8X923_9FIRM|nr:hypothetical protein AN396_10860 [Epulopiscium sp. SCG-B11WGA-EpuloA1]ONI38958.1 hypothetical protein AN639_01900 [Epulopiscium sp. SCG-B05WGA-EpuloA1]
MNVEKVILEEFEKLYAQGVIRKNGKPIKYLGGAEAQGEGFAVDVDDFSKKQILWEGENQGGTMTICQINDNGDFYANERFFPIFHAPECVLVYGKLEGNEYKVSEVQKIPYLHRFDVIDVGEDKVFVGATLAKEKADKDDWSKPGEILIGKLDKDPSKPFEIKVLKEGITKNHGYCTTTYNGKRVILITGIEGLFCIYIPEKYEDTWKIEHMMDFEISDACTVDIDNDGQDEIVTIEKFHGNELNVYKKEETGWKKIFSKEIAFGHGLWGGKLLGKNRFLAGWRQGTKELVCFTKDGDKFDEFVLGEGGTSQFSVWEDDGKAYVLSADRQAKGQVGQLVIYTLTK